MHEGKRTRANLQVLQKMSYVGFLVVNASDVVVQWVVLGYHITDVDFPSFRSPHYNIIAQIDVTIAVKRVRLSSKFELLQPEGFQHLQNIKQNKDIKGMVAQQCTTFDNSDSVTTLIVADRSTGNVLVGFIGITREMCLPDVYNISLI